MKTATEKYNAVLEGTMAKREFVRQMRQQFPQFISQFNGFDDSVQILKNKGMIFESKKEKDTGYKVPEVNIPLDVIERGVDAELEAAGIDSAGVVTKEEYLEAKRKALHNLKKDMNHYLNLMAGESSKVDKNDKMKETKRGAQDKDTFNDMKKADLKEGTPGEHPDGSPKSNAEMGDDEREDFYNNLDSVDEQPVPSAKDNIIRVASAIRAHYKGIPRFNSILKDYLQTHQEDIKSGMVDDPIDDFNNYIDANYDRLNEASRQMEAKGKDLDGDGDIDDKDYLAAKDRAIKRATNKKVDEIGMFHDPIGFKKPELSPKDLEYTKEYLGNGVYAIYKNGKKVKTIEGGDGIANAWINQQKRATNKKVNEAVKNIIVNLLSEQVINEAATANLANFAEEYSDFEGMKQNIIALQDIVTDIESFYDKTRQKIQKIYSGLGEIKNDEGLKVGAFLAPSIETAFNKDLAPVIKQGFTKGLETPKIRTISQADIDRVNAGGELEEDPKQTVFSPVQESKKRK